MNQIDKTHQLRTIEYAKDIEGSAHEFKSVCYTALSFLAIFVMLVCGAVCLIW